MDIGNISGGETFLEKGKCLIKGHLKFGAPGKRTGISIISHDF